MRQRQTLEKDAYHSYAPTNSIFTDKLTVVLFTDKLTPPVFCFVSVHLLYTERIFGINNKPTVDRHAKETTAPYIINLVSSEFVSGSRITHTMILDMNML